MSSRMRYGARFGAGSIEGGKSTGRWDEYTTGKLFNTPPKGSLKACFIVAHGHAYSRRARQKCKLPTGDDLKRAVDKITS